MFIAGLLVILGLFPAIGGFLSSMPKPVLGGATLIMFGTVAAAGIKIIASAKVGRREMLILAVSLGLGLGVQMVPDVLSSFPDLAKTIFASTITTGGLTALVLNLIIPRDVGEIPVDAA
jgi:xanthine permease XanP